MGGRTVRRDDLVEPAAATFELAARVCQVMERLGLADWFNLPANGNWGLLPGGSPHLHVHIYARRRSGKTWAQPVELPKAPGTFGFEPLAETDRARLAAAISEAFSGESSGRVQPGPRPR